MTGRGLSAHDIEAVPNSGGGFTHYCHVCGQMGVTLAPMLPCLGPPAEGRAQATCPPPFGTPVEPEPGTLLGVRLDPALDGDFGDDECRHTAQGVPLLAVWNQQPFAPRHARHPDHTRTVCGIDARGEKWEMWQQDWHSFVDGGGTACRRCVRMTRDV